MGQKWIGANHSLSLLSGFAGGAITLRFAEVLWTPLPLILLASCGLLVIFVRQLPRRLVLFCFASALGYIWSSVAAMNLLQYRLPENLQKKDLQVIGTVTGIVESEFNGEHQVGVSFDFNIQKLVYQGAKYTPPGRARLRTYFSDFVPQTGEVWALTIRLKQVHGLQNPGGSFDYEAWLLQQRILATGYVVDKNPERLSAPQTITALLDKWVSGLRIGFAGTISDDLNPSAHISLITALTVGLKTGITDDQWRVLQDTGTAHLMAISGLHIGLVAGLVGWFACRVWRFAHKLNCMISAASMGVVCGLIAGLFYAAMAGFALPTLRALVMLVIVSVAIVLKRRASPVHLLAAALVVVLLIDPLSPLSASFWLSFVAVMVLVLTFSGAKHSDDNQDRVDKRWHERFLRSLVHTLKKWTFAQWWLLVGMMPILLVSFQKISLIAPIANLFAVPIVGMGAVPLALSAMVASSLGAEALSILLLEAAESVINVVWILLEWLASLPSASWQGPLPSFGAMLIAIAGLALLILGKHVKGRWLGLLWLLPLFVANNQQLEHGDYLVTILDVGQGLGVVIETQNHSLLFDAGASYPSGFNLGQAVVVPYLRWRGISAVDKAFISHSDNDHIGGMKAVVDEIGIHALYSSDKANARMSESFNQCDLGQQWHWDGVDFLVVWPLVEEPYDGNNSSCVVLVTSNVGSVLLSGDIEVDGEQSLVNLGVLPGKITLLQVPHHGSKTSSSDVFIDALNPSLAISSAGYLNRYRHPHTTVVSRYQTRSIPFLQTAEEGAIQVKFTAGDIQLTGYRNQHRRFWRLPGKAPLNLIENALNQEIDQKGNDTIPTYTQK